MDRQFAFREFAQAVRRSVGPFALTAAMLLLPAHHAAARGPDNIADVAEQVIDAVVNISTSQKVETRLSPMPSVPPGSPMEEFFDEFFKNRRGQGGDNQDHQLRRVNSLGSGFIIDPAGFVVTNNHVIAEADEINVILNDGTKLAAELVGKDAKSDLAVLRVHTDKPLKAVKFGDSGKLRLGEWVIAIGNPFSLGGSVTAGIVSARNRDLSGPYDNYIQTDAAINKGNSGGPLFNLEGEVVGINTAIYSPSGSGGSVGIGFAVPSENAIPVIDQLRQYGETRRGWLGVHIQRVTDDIADSLDIKPPRGALVAGVDDKGPAKPGGIEPGDVIIKFDGRDVKTMHDLPRIVADTPIGKHVDVVVIRRGKEEVRHVEVGRLDDTDKKLASLEPKKDVPPPDQSVVQKTLGLELSGLTDDLRRKFKIRDNIKGVVVTAVDPSVDHPEPDKHLGAGDVIVEVQYEAVGNPADLQARIDSLKAVGKKIAILLVANAQGETRFVALTLQ